MELSAKKKWNRNWPSCGWPEAIVARVLGRDTRLRRSPEPAVDNCWKKNHNLNYSLLFIKSFNLETRHGSLAKKVFRYFNTSWKSLKYGSQVLLNFLEMRKKLNFIFTWLKIWPVATLEITFSASGPNEGNICWRKNVLFFSKILVRGTR